MEPNFPVSTHILVGVQSVLNSQERTNHFTTRMTHLQWAEWTGGHSQDFTVIKKPCRIIKKLRLIKKRKKKRSLEKYNH